VAPPYVSCIGADVTAERALGLGVVVRLADTPIVSYASGVRMK